MDRRRAFWLIVVVPVVARSERSADSWGKATVCPGGPIWSRAGTTSSSPPQTRARAIVFRYFSKPGSAWVKGYEAWVDSNVLGVSSDFECVADFGFRILRSSPLVRVRERHQERIEHPASGAGGRREFCLRDCLTWPSSILGVTGCVAQADLWGPSSPLASPERSPSDTIVRNPFSDPSRWKEKFPFCGFSGQFADCADCAGASMAERATDVQFN